MNTIEIRHVEKFPEPEFTRMNRAVFVDIQQPSAELAQALACEAVAAPASAQIHAPMYRLGAYVGEEIVGWTIGWMERGNVFYVANSGVLAAHRRKGIYSLLLSAIHEHARANGAVASVDWHQLLWEISMSYIDGYLIPVTEGNKGARA